MRRRRRTVPPVSALLGGLVVFLRDAVALVAFLLAVQDFGLGLQLSALAARACMASSACCSWAAGDLGHDLFLLLDGLAQQDGEIVGILGQTAEMRTIKTAEGRIFWGRGGMRDGLLRGHHGGCEGAGSRGPGRSPEAAGVTVARGDGRDERIRILSGRRRRPQDVPAPQAAE
ncbi:hypothetical protein [Streptomyces yanii]|uniref:Uncharacterized protein n=1 Tax=Streptomyces yanii TaxID=78510 RepID=A0ABV5R2C9_9ACTN